jgi:N-acetylmuramoyl-L-alanine amidase
MMVWEGQFMKKTLGFILLFVSLLSFPYHAWAVKVVIDPGHGGRNPGAVGINGLYEKDVNNDISSKLRDILISRGYEAVLTRETDEDMTLDERVQFTNRAAANLFVSVHANSHHDRQIKGSLILYYDRNHPQPRYPASAAMTALSPQSKRLAQHVLEEIVKEAGTENRGLMASSAYVVRMGEIPSILVETAFLSNHKDAAQLTDPVFRQKLAVGIANGIEAYMPVVFGDIAGHWAQEAILRMKRQGIAAGDNPNTFSPNRPITRAEFMTMLDRMLSFGERVEQMAAHPMEQLAEPSPGANGADDERSIDSAPIAEENTHIFASKREADTNGTASYKFATLEKGFSDLKEEYWAYGSLKKSISLGYLRGYPDGTLRPGQAITRAEVAVLLDRILPEYKQIAPLAGKKLFYQDVSPDNWAAGAIYRMKQASLIRGVELEKFYPDRNTTRAEIAVIIDRYTRLQE